MSVFYGLFETRIHICVQLYAYTYICIYVYMYICIYVYMICIYDMCIVYSIYDIKSWRDSSNDARVATGLRPDPILAAWQTYGTKPGGKENVGQVVLLEAIRMPQSIG